MKSDRRVRYTRKALQQALLEILKEKRIERVSVKEICECADVNRSTFYVHFGSPQELLNSVRQDMIEELCARKLEETRSVKAWMTQICRVIYEYREWVSALVRSGNAMDLYALISGVWKDDFMRGMRDRFPSDEQAELAYLYVTTGASGVIFTWALGGFQMSYEALTEQVYPLVMHGLNLWFE